MNGKNEIRLNTATLTRILDEWWKRNTVALGVQQEVTHVKYVQTESAFVITLNDRQTEKQSD